MIWFISVVLMLITHLLTTTYGYNLAYKKPTWQTLNKYSSQNAVDGVYSNLSSIENQCAVSLGSTNVTWLVDLEAIQSISEIILHPLTDGKQFANSTFASRFLGFSVYVSNTTIKEDGILCYHDTDHTVVNIPANMTINCDVQGRYVIYYNTRAGNLKERHGYSAQAYVNLCEVEVYGCPLGFFDEDCHTPCPRYCRHCDVVSGECLGGCSPGFSGHSCESYDRISMAVHRPTYQLHTYDTGQPSFRVVDGKRSNLKFNGNQCTSTSDKQVFAMWRVDLQRLRLIERILVYYRTDNKTWDVNNGFTRRFLGFTVVVSNTTDHNDGVICYRDRKYNKYTVPPSVDIFCSVIGRYVIYYNERLPGIDYHEDYSQYAFSDLCEVEVYGCPIIDYGWKIPKCTIPCMAMCKNHLENLSYKKETWQSSTYSSLGTSDKAVDGHYSSRNYRHGQCALTKLNQRRVTWWVNLGKIYKIDHIVLYFRTENLRWGFSNEYMAVFLGFFLYISNTTDRRNGILCYHDMSLARHTIPDIMSINCSYSGQYVIFYNERLPGVFYPSGYSKDARADLCEVQVYGCPSPVSEITQCSRPCPTNCEKCYQGTGICYKCNAGFEGYACEIACHALANVTVSPVNIPQKFIYDMLTSSQGILFPEIRSGKVEVNLTLSERFSNIAKLYFNLKKANEVVVRFRGRNHSLIKNYHEKYTEQQEMDVTVLNDKISKVFHIQISVTYEFRFTMSDLRLPLRKCSGYAMDMMKEEQDAFKNV